ncbi:MAG: nucleotidyl transferase [Parcubacteria group bacterium Greene0416_79]|nr:MAG: nucleotidyl transferase [Parcubacteria group bacterium Greene0416_79]
MKAIILAAGEGKRMLPLTRSVPKPLLRIKNKTILDYIFAALPEEIDHVVIVVGYLKKKIQEHIVGDDMANREEVVSCLSFEYSWVCAPSEYPRVSGIATIGEDRCIVEVIEKPEDPKSNMSAAGVMVIGSEIFNYTPTRHLNGEFYLTSLMNQFVKNYKVHAVIGDPRPQFISPDEIVKLNLL